MSSSAHKDMFHAMFIHKIPANLSKAEFESKFEPLIDEVVQLPLVQKNLVKLDLIIQNERVDDHTPAFGFPPREHIVLVAIQAETPEHLFAVLAAPEVRKVMAKGKEFELHGSSYAFSADVFAKIDNPTPQDGAHMICVYNMSSRKYTQEFHEFMDNFVQVPACRKHFVRSEVWQSNDVLEDHIRAFGYSPAGPTFIHHAKLESWENAMEMIQDSEAQKFVQNAGSVEKDLRQNGYVFACHVVTKLDKSA